MVKDSLSILTKNPKGYYILQVSMKELTGMDCKINDSSSQPYHGTAQHPECPLLFSF
jgi:hypothetical protein